MARIEYTDWTVPVAQVGSRAGQTMQIDRDFPAPGGIGDSIVGVKEGEPIHVNGQFDSIIDGLIFTGTFTAPVTAVCARCDRDLSGDWSEQVTAFFPYEDADAGKTKNEDVEIIAGEEESGDTYPLIDNGAFANIEPLLRDTFVSALPLNPLCKLDCKGLCPQCGLDLNESPEHVHEVADLRFADLEALKEQLEREQGE